MFFAASKTALSIIILSHSGIEGNELAGSVARSALRFPFIVYCGVPRKDLLPTLETDFKFWCSILWPYVGSVDNSSRYLDRITFKTRGPWFTGYNFSRSYISVITRLRSTHVYTGTHLGRMEWDLNMGCGCVAGLKDLAHVINECPILSQNRPRFLRFLAERFPERLPEQTNLGNLIFAPDPGAVGELGIFLRSSDLII